MATNFISQEILLVINTQFSAKEYIKKEEEEGTSRTAAENLADACWNGILYERIPEISMHKDSKPLPIRRMNEGEKILYIKLGENDSEPDAEYTINPYLNAEHFCLN